MISSAKGQKEGTEDIVFFERGGLFMIRKKLVKTVTAGLLSTVMVLSMVGCGETEKENSTGNGADKQKEAGESAKEGDGKKIADGDVTLTIFCGMPSAARAYYKDLNDHPVVQKISEETGLKFEFVHPPQNDDGSFFQQLLASGELPDLFHTSMFQTNYPGGIEGAIEDRVLKNVDEEIGQFATNFNTWIAESDDPDIQKKIRSDAGTIIKFGSIWLPEFNDKKIHNGFIVRQDWLDKYGLEMPVTLDDYTNVLQTFKDHGVQVPLSIPAFSDSQFDANNPIASAFGVSFDNFDLDENGKVVYSRTNKSYKEFLEFMKGWAEKGFIDRDFISRTGDDARKLFYNGTAGMTFSHSFNVKEALTAGKAIDENFAVAGIVHPRQKKDDVLRNSHVVSSINSMSWQISDTCEHVEEAIKFVDYLHDPDTMLMTAWGVGDENSPTFEVNENGERKFTSFVTDNPDGKDYTTIRGCYTLEEFQVMYDETMEKQQYNLPENEQAWEAWLTNNGNAGVLPSYLTLTVDESKELTSIQTKLSNYSDEMVYKFIFGEVSLDEFDTFVQTLKELGSERAEEIYQQAYDRYVSR